MMKSGKAKLLLQLIPRKKFEALCSEWKMDDRVRSFSTWEQMCTHILSYLLRLESLREVESVLGVKRSTFSDANLNRSSGFFQALCEMILGEIGRQTSSRKVRRAMKELLALDSTECHVHGSIASNVLWQHKKAKNKVGSVKLHTIWNVDEERIEDFRITPGRNNDSPIANQFELMGGATYVFDRAYNDLALWWNIVSLGSDFVTRLKSSSVLPDAKRKKALKSDRVGVLWEGTWVPTHSAFHKHPSIPKDLYFRHIVYRDPETKKHFDFVTSDNDVTAQVIADNYKRRWAVELLFRWLKGHLNIRYLAVRNPNSLKIQMAVAVLVQLLVQLYRIKTNLGKTLWETLRELRMALIREGLGDLFQKISRSPRELIQCV
jgi:putative transposase